MKRFFKTASCLIATALLSVGATAQTANGGIDAKMLNELKESYKPTTAEKAM